jgi:hypothetical protein
LYQFAFKRTLASTAASLVGGQHPTYDYRMAGAGEVILTRTQAKDARLAFVREAGSMYTVFNKSRGDVIAEVPSSSGEDLYLAVPAGEYRVVRRIMGNVSERTLTLAPGSMTTVEPIGMIAVPQGSPRNKGGDFYLHSRLGAYAGVSTSVVPGTSYLGTVALSYAYAFRWVVLRARASVASFDSQQDAYHSSLLRASANMDVLLPLLLTPNWAIQVGPSLGVPMVRQRDMRGLVSNSYGFAYGGAAVISARIYDRTYLSLNLDGGGEVFRLDGARVHRATGSALLGGVVAF